ncbi:MAG: hypothetical protein ACKOAG_10825, partial [Candidatus Kapaibacterium sp.]
QPARHTVTTKIHWDSPCSPAELETSLFDIVGGLVDGDLHSSRISMTAAAENSASLTINCSGLIPGVYVIRVRFKNYDKTIPFIVQ